MSQDALGEKIGKSQQSVAGYESGQPEPNLSIYRKIAKETNVSPAWLIFGDEGGHEAGPGGVSELDKNKRLFAWAFHEAAKMFAEEGLEAEFSYALSFTLKLLREPNKGASQAQAKETILRAIEVDRAEFRKSLDQARKKLL